MALQLRRVKLIDRMAHDPDVSQLFKMQGALRELEIIDRMPSEIESLDKLLERAEELRTMQKDRA